MRSERAAVRFRDILKACDLIDRWVAEEGGAEAAVLNRDQARSAIERQLLVISEAAHRLYRLDPHLAPGLAPTIDWAGIRGIGNFIRHRYDDLDASMIVSVIENRLGELRAACANAVRKLGG